MNTSDDKYTDWQPSENLIKQSNLAQWMQQLKFSTLHEFHSWSTEHFADFWNKFITDAEIVFKKKFSKIYEDTSSTPMWLPHAKMNIVDSCFLASPRKKAIVYQDSKQKIKTLSYQALEKLVNQIANGLIACGFKPSDRIAINMPMHKEAVAIYLAIIKIGAVVVSIADSFSPQEIATRLTITQCKAIFTQFSFIRDGKEIALYQKIIDANSPLAIVLGKKISSFRESDLLWKDFLKPNDTFESHPCDPNDACNILFSSGTTGVPKAIPWTHTTPIKTMSDAFFHHDVHPTDIFAWPTNLGWMMGPWLVFATLLNKATLALYEDVPKNKAFGDFIEHAGVTKLGVIPTIVAHWRKTRCMEENDWSKIKLFTSTGECSNVYDMSYLMKLCGNKPIIEYCGGTEIGGAYITSTIIQNNYPSLFSTKAIGNDFVLLNEDNEISDSQGEVALITPALGLSTQLLNADHDSIYFKNMPKGPNGKSLRRHGDILKKLANGYYSVLGRSDDTMNLGGIKISAVEIERALAAIDNIKETAAIAINPSNGGPTQLIIYTVLNEQIYNANLKKLMQDQINNFLNPLFKIHDVVIIDELPKTASNKIMRKKLRATYLER